MPPGASTSNLGTTAQERWSRLRIAVVSGGKIAFDKPDKERARLKAEEARVRDPLGRPYSLMANLDQLNVGVGTKSLLKFTRDLAVIYFFVAVGFCTPLYSNVLNAGEGQGIASFTIISFLSFDKPPLLHTISDFVACSIFLLGWAWSRHVLAKLERGGEQRAPRTSDFCVFLSGLDPSTTANDIRRALSRYGDIVHVALSLDNSMLIEAITEMRALRYKMQRHMFIQRTAATPESPIIARERLGDLEAKHAAACTRARVLRRMRARCTGHAFVTFLHKYDALLCIEKIKTVEILGRRVTFQHPGEPSDIIWENLKCTSRDRVARTAGVTLACLGLNLFCSAVIAFVSDPQVLSGPNAGFGARLGIQAAFTVITIIFNVTLFVLVPVFTRFERHSSRTDEQSTSMVHFLLFQCINQLGGLFTLAFYSGGFNERWFSVAATYMLFALVGDMTVILIGLELIRPDILINRYLLAPKDLTHRELIQHYELPTISPAFRYQLILKFAVMSLIFAFAFPVLPLMGTVALIESYWIDKRCVLRVFRQPPSFSPAIARIVVWFIMPSGLIAHAVGSIFLLLCRSPVCELLRHTFLDFTSRQVITVQFWLHVGLLAMCCAVPVVNWLFHDCVRLRTPLGLKDTADLERRVRAGLQPLSFREAEQKQRMEIYLPPLTSTLLKSFTDDLLMGREPHDRGQCTRLSAFLSARTASLPAVPPRIEMEAVPVDRPPSTSPPSSSPTAIAATAASATPAAAPAAAVAATSASSISRGVTSRARTPQEPVGSFAGATSSAASASPRDAAVPTLKSRASRFPPAPVGAPRTVIMHSPSAPPPATSPISLRHGGGHDDHTVNTQLKKPRAVPVAAAAPRGRSPVTPPLQAPQSSPLRGGLSPPHRGPAATLVIHGGTGTSPQPSPTTSSPTPWTTSALAAAGAGASSTGASSDGGSASVGSARSAPTGSGGALLYTPSPEMLRLTLSPAGLAPATATALSPASPLSLSRTGDAAPSALLRAYLAAVCPQAPPPPPPPPAHGRPLRASKSPIPVPTLSNATRRRPSPIPPSSSLSTPSTAAISPPSASPPTLLGAQRAARSGSRSGPAPEGSLARDAPARRRTTQPQAARTRLPRSHRRRAGATAAPSRRSRSADSSTTRELMVTMRAPVVRTMARAMLPRDSQVGPAAGATVTSPFDRAAGLGEGAISVDQEGKTRC